MRQRLDKIFLTRGKYTAEILSRFGGSHDVHAVDWILDDRFTESDQS